MAAPWHMEVLRPGFESEPQLQQCQILQPTALGRDGTHTSTAAKLLQWGSKPTVPQQELHKQFFLSAVYCLLELHVTKYQLVHQSNSTLEEGTTAND